MGYTSLKACQVGAVVRHFELAKSLSNIEVFQANELSLVPPMVIATVMAPTTKHYILKSVEAATIGAAHLEKGPRMRYKALIDECAPSTQVYAEFWISSTCQLNAL